MPTTSASFNNSSPIRPMGFYLTGFTSLPFADLYLILLALVFVATVLSNLFVITVIFIEHSLHTPKYIAIANLAAVDLGLSVAIIPEMLKAFLFKENFISFNSCLNQMFFSYLFLCLEAFSLTVLAYDRLISICFPLHQNSINTTTSMLSILTIIWTFCVLLNVYTATIITELSFCDSLQVYSYFCDYSPVFTLACNDFSLQWNTASACSMTILFGSVSFIIISYSCILVAVFRMKTVNNRQKALGTCTGHLVLVAVFYLPTITFFVLSLFLSESNYDIRTLNLSLATCAPPFLNPVVYSLKTKELRKRAFHVLKKMKVGSEL